MNNVLTELAATLTIQRTILTMGIAIVLMMFAMISSYMFFRNIHITIVASIIPLGLLAFLDIIPIWTFFLPVPLILYATIKLILSEPKIEETPSYIAITDTEPEIENITTKDGLENIIQTMPILVAAAIISGAIKKVAEVSMVNQLTQDPKKLPVRTAIETTNISSGEKLLSEFEKLKYDTGIRAFTKLKKEYDGVFYIFNNNELDNSIIDTNKIKKLINSVYNQGLSFANSIKDLYYQYSQTDITELEEENKELAEQLASLSETSKIKSTLQEMFEKNSKNLSTIKGFNDKINEQLCQLHLCRESIREIRLSLPELINHRSDDELDKLIHELNVRVNLAQRLEKEYTKQGV